MSPSRGHDIGPKASAAGWADVVAGRDLLRFLAWRDIKVRYTQAALGVGWAVLQPLLMMAVFALFFGRLAKLPSDGAPYALFAFAGLVPWTFFSNAVGGATQSLVANANLLTKVFFPRLFLPVAAVGSWLPDLAIGTVMVLVLAMVMGDGIGLSVLAVPALCALAAVAAAAASIGLAALNVEFRDVRYAVPFLLQLWLFVTPVVYPASIVPARLQWALALNPMTGVVEGFRWAILGTSEGVLGSVLVSTASTLVIGAVGLAYFRHVERGFADVV
jgi:lipopolysaccharide transport system permease protein